MAYSKSSWLDFYNKTKAVEIVTIFIILSINTDYFFIFFYLISLRLKHRVIIDVFVIILVSLAI